MDGHDDVHQRALIRLARRLLGREIAPPAIVPITRKLPQEPLRQSMGSVLTRDDHELFQVGSEVTVVVHVLVRPSSAIKSYIHV